MGDYEKVQFGLINSTIENFDWNELFSGHNIDNQVSLFNRAILNFFQNVIQSKKRGSLGEHEIRLLIKWKNMFHTERRDNRLDLLLNKLSED